MKRRKLFLIFAIVALISSCGQKAKKEVDSTKERDTTTFNLADFWDIESDTILETEKDSILNGKLGYFFFYSPEQFKRKMTNPNYFSGIPAHNYVNNNVEYTELNHSGKKPDSVSTLVFIGDSATKITTTPIKLEELLFEKINY